MRCLRQVVYSLLFLLLFGFIMFQWKRFSTGNLLRCFLRKPKEHMFLFKTTGKSGDKFSQFPPNVPSKMDHHNLSQNPKVLPKPHPENTSPRQPTGDRAIEAPEHQRLSILLPFRFSSLTVLFTLSASAMACGSEGQRTQAFDRGRVPRRPGPWGVMGCTCSCGWVFRKYVDYRWVFWHDCARIHSSSDRVISRWY